MREQQLLQNAYDEALARHEKSEGAPTLGENGDVFLGVIIDHQDSSKAVLAVTATLLLKKVCDPKQDIRRHQAGIEGGGGFSGRGLDGKIVTPFLQEHDFPFMASGSGWLTRSLEQAVPYELNYPGKISPARVKNAFLGIVDLIEKGQVDASDALIALFMGLIDFREMNTAMVLARPIHLTVGEIAEKVRMHYGTGISGSSRLPVLAIHSVLAVLVEELARYDGCQLLPLEEHTASDTRSGLIGDIHIQSDSGAMYEAFEIKHDIEVTPEIVNASFEKFQTTRVERYYILTTHPSGNDPKLDDSIQGVQQKHGCQLIVNGVEPTLKYYLRLVDSTTDFVDKYVTAVEQDSAVSYALKKAWNEVVGI